MTSIIAISKRDGVPTHVAADTLALERIAAISSMERLHTGHPYGRERPAGRLCSRQAPPERRSEKGFESWRWLNLSGKGISCDDEMNAGAPRKRCEKGYPRRESG